MFSTRWHHSGSSSKLSFKDAACDQCNHTFLLPDIFEVDGVAVLSGRWTMLQIIGFALHLTLRTGFSWLLDGIFMVGGVVAVGGGTVTAFDIVRAHRPTRQGHWGKLPSPPWKSLSLVTKPKVQLRCAFSTICCSAVLEGSYKKPVIGLQASCT